VKFGFTGVATIGACPVCAITAVEEPEPLWPSSRSAFKSNGGLDSPAANKTPGGIEVPMTPEPSQMNGAREGATMRALVTYLLAIGILVAVGYAGFVRLAKPSPTHVAARSQPGTTSSETIASEPDRTAQERASNSAPIGEEKLASRRVNEGKTELFRTAKGEDLDESKPGSTPSSIASAESHDAKATGRLTDQTGTIRVEVPPSTCMPIGMTAQGDLVFPLQCRELLERERNPAPSPEVGPPKQAAGGDVQTVGPLRDQETVHSASTVSDVRSRVRSPGSEATPKTNVSRTVTEHGNRPPKARWSSQSSIDSHREERLPAVRRARMVALHSDEWRSPLSLHCIECLVFGFH
jgi:hypothetical protein